jgi:hypothetical protein
MFEHGVKDGEQLAHRRSPGELARFARGKQAVIEGGDDRVFVSRDHGRHIERGAHTGALAYADQNEKDYAALVAAAKAGRIKAEVEEEEE